MEGGGRHKRKTRKITHDWDPGWEMKRKISAIKKEVEKRRNALGLVSVDSYWESNLPILDARDALKRGMGKPVKIRSLFDLARTLDELNPEEREKFFGEMAKITGEKEYHQTSDKTRKLVKAISEKAERPVILDVGTSKGKYITELLAKSKMPKKVKLIQTNLSAIPPKMVKYPKTQVSERIYKTDVHVSKIHKMIEESPHLIIVKDVLKFLQPEESKKALNSLSKIAKEGTIVLIGDEIPMGEVKEKEGYIVEDSSKLHAHVKVGNKLEKVNVDKLLELLENSKDWEDYLKRLKEGIREIKT